MMNIREFYDLGLPIDTELGQVDFIKVKDYPDYFFDLQNVSMSKLKVIQEYENANKDGSLDDLIKAIKECSLFELYRTVPDLRESYFKVFTKVFEDESNWIEGINEDNFEDYRQLILDMACIKEEKINPNPEIQRAIERSRRLKSAGQDKMTFSDIFSSVIVGSGADPEKVLNWTVYQLYSIYHRISKFKSFDLTSLFATVPTEKPVDIDMWGGHVDLFEEESHGGMTRKEFNKKAGSING
ncbi:hypothetical protein GCM10008931_42800 [Oceanobacillus oncorhynchi subsp. oncorhynchi]|uniref:hypothetical protein n=1 Tax=Oceanobacillus oncorhynchi TaxID=545501 RepID=UPI0031E31455